MKPPGRRILQTADYLHRQGSFIEWEVRSKFTELETRGGVASGYVYIISTAKGTGGEMWDTVWYILWVSGDEGGWEVG